MSLPRHLVLGAVLSTLATPVLAAPPPAPAAKPAAKAAPVEVKPSANELARILMPRKTWEDGLAALSKDVQGRMQMHPGAKLDFPADFGKQVRAELDQALPYDSLLELHAKELSAGYSEQELKDLVGFYKTPTGQKSLQVMPAVSEKVAVATQQRVESKMPGIMERLSAKVKSGGKPAKK